MLYLAKFLLVMLIVMAAIAMAGIVGVEIGTAEMVFYSVLGTAIVGLLLACAPRLARLAAHRRVDPFIHGYRGKFRKRLADRRLRLATRRQSGGKSSIRFSPPTDGRPY